MIWESAKPQYGDMVRVKSGHIYHYGVFVSESEIIQFGLAPTARMGVKDCDVAVCVSNETTFLHGGIMERAVLNEREISSRVPCEKTVEKARSRIGEKGYNILYNNCEHFAYECVMGVKKCTQTDDLRSMFHNMPIVDLYVTKIPDEVTLSPVYPIARTQEIDNCKNDRVKREKYCAWRLLEYALRRSFGLCLSKMPLKKGDDGKWVADDCFFSLSHCDGVVAVAVSRKPVGVDVEKITDKMEKIKTKFLTEKELCQYVEQTDKSLYLAEKWTQKESIFKQHGGKAFLPDKIETSEYKTHTARLKDFDGYVFSVAADEIKLVRSYQNVDYLS